MTEQQTTKAPPSRLLHEVGGRVQLSCCYTNSKLDIKVLWSIHASQVALVVKNLPANAGDIRDVDSIPGSGRSPGGGHGNPLQYCCLKNSMDREAWWATVHGDAKHWIRRKLLSSHMVNSPVLKRSRTVWYLPPPPCSLPSFCLWKTLVKE